MNIARRAYTALTILFVLLGAGFWLVLPAEPKDLASAENVAPESAFDFLLPAGVSMPDRGAEFYQEIDNRPIFVPERKKLKVPAIDGLEITGGEEPLPFQLLGLIDSSSRKIAIIKKPGDQNSIILHLDQTVEGWTLKDVQHDVAIFQSNDRQNILHLVDYTTAPEAPDVNAIFEGQGDIQ